MFDGEQECRLSQAKSLVEVGSSNLPGPTLSP
jgi:hypothetical protein